MSPIFMIGTQRSGSNLLRLMMNQLNEIASPHPPHIMERIQPLLSSYGDLTDNSNFELLIDDVCKLVEANPVEWTEIKLDRKQIQLQCRDHSLAAIHGAIYDTYAQVNNAQTWCCKSLANIHHVEQLDNYFDNAKYVYLYRDGRDVALSFQKAVVGEKHIYNIAKDWTETQEKALALRKSIPSDRFFSISYEELTADSENSAKALCKFLGVEFSPSMFDFHKTNEAKNAASSSELWQNVTQPVIADNSKKFLKSMSKNDLRIFESVAGNVLDQLGFERFETEKGKEITFNDDQIKIFNVLNEELKEKMMASIDKDDLMRRKKQNHVLKVITSRSAA